MRYLIKVDELKEKVDFLEQQYKIIEEDIDNLKKLKSTIIWHGEAAVKFFNIYDGYIRELSVIQANIKRFNDYLASYYSKYDEESKNFKNKYCNVVKGDNYGKDYIR